MRKRERERERERRMVNSKKKWLRRLQSNVQFHKKRTIMFPMALAQSSRLWLFNKLLI